MKKEKFNFLLADDSKSSRHMVRHMVVKSGIPIDEIFIAENGQEALDLLEIKEVDIILTDIVMPIMNGIELISNVKKSIKHSHIPIIPVSSLGSKKDIEYFKKNGIDIYITKIVTQEKINEILKSALNIPL